MAEQREEEEENIKLICFLISLASSSLISIILSGLSSGLSLFVSECYDEDDMPWLYPQARGILCALKDKVIEMAVASRSPTSHVATAFLAMLDIQSMFVGQEIFSSWTHKTEHFQRIHMRTGIPFNSMLFFDDEYRNIEAVSKMGVTCILVDRGLNLEALRQGLSNFSRKSLGMNGRN